MVFLLGLQVPQECPQAVNDVVFACLNQDPDKRPSAQQIIHVIEASTARQPSSRISGDSGNIS